VKNSSYKEVSREAGNPHPRPLYGKLYGIYYSVNSMHCSKYNRYIISFHSQPVVHACVWCWHYSGPNLPLRLRDVSCTPFVCADAVSYQRRISIRLEEVQDNNV
jgi:hypothetical protein